MSQTPEGTDNYEIYDTYADGSHPKRLTHAPGPDGFPDWSPDGSKIAFSSERDDCHPIHRLENPAEGWRRSSYGRAIRQPDDHPERANSALHLSARLCGAGREGLHDRRSIDASLHQWLPREADVSTRSTLRSGTNHATATAM
jgi:hypothetical protein